MIALHSDLHLTDSKSELTDAFLGYWNSKYFNQLCKPAKVKARKIIYMDESLTQKTKTHAEWMQLALETARMALPQDVPVGALLVSNGELIAQGFNRRELDQNPVAHAEILALQAAAAHLARWRLTDTVLYVTLEPCPMCASAIQQARVDQVIFGAADPVMGACGSQYGLLLDSPERPVLGGVLEDKCSTLLRDFFRQARTH